ncbi:MAG: uroporphyrinogen-III C-methyltransferase [Gammaproteobacteria bacterium]
MNTEIINGGGEKTDDSQGSVAGKKVVSSHYRTPIFIALFAIIALAMSAYSYYTTNKLQQGMDPFRTTFNQVNELQKTVTDLVNDNQRITEAIRAFTGKQEALTKRLNSLYQGRNKGTLELALAEVEYLLIIATHRLVLEADTRTALTAMQAASDRLQNIDDSRVLAARRQLVLDMNALKSVNEVDISGMAMYLADIIERVSRLPVKQPVSKAGTQQSKPAPQTVMKVPLWRRLAGRVWQELKGLVVISRNGQEAVISLLPEERYYLYQNLRLQLETARLAVMRRDTQNLHASIGIINGWIRKYFDSSDAAVNNIVDSLTRMSGIELRPELPDISSSLETLRALIRDLPDQGPVGPGSTEDPAL